MWILICVSKSVPSTQMLRNNVFVSKKVCCIFHEHPQLKTERGVPINGELGYVSLCSDCTSSSMAIVLCHSKKNRSAVRNRARHHHILNPAQESRRNITPSCTWKCVQRINCHIQIVVLVFNGISNGILNTFSYVRPYSKSAVFSVLWPWPLDAGMSWLVVWMKTTLDVWTHWPHTQRTGPSDRPVASGRHRGGQKNTRGA